MLHLIQNNKFGKNVNGSEVKETNWRLLFKTNEDSLTASVFSLLFYLPVELFWKILNDACYHPALPKQAGRLLNYEFWPHWNCEGTSNTNFVEPDVFIQFENFDLIIEAKRIDYAQQQDRAQWEKEIVAYYNEYAEEKKSLYFIALGGIEAGKEKQEPVTGFKIDVNICRWKRILHQVHVAQEIIKKTTNLLNSNNAISFVLQDLILAFRIHGFFTGELFNTMPKGMCIKYPIGIQKLIFNKRTNFKLLPKEVRNINYQNITRLYGTTIKG